jgi:hypothetical protein
MNKLVDKIYIISVKDRLDRRKEIIKNFKKFKLNYEFYLVDKLLESPIYGCYKSHMEVIKLAHNLNLNRILIFEDDAYFINHPKWLLKKIKYFLNNNEWDIFYLGGLQYYKYNNYNKYIVEGEWIFAHSYILNKNSINFINNHNEILPKNFSFPDFFYTILYQLRKFGLKYSICFQTNSPSDLNWPIYLNFYKYICNFIAKILDESDFYVMVRISEWIYDLTPDYIINIVKTFRIKYNQIRYLIYKKFGKKIPLLIYWYLIPL